jgi:(p)ppGpp synthase/HD superfamily hydrolase
VSSLHLAVQVAARAHQHQKRKDGTPYVAHPFKVLLRAQSMITEGFPFEPVEGQDVQIVAILHDVVEDTDVTFDELRELGFSENVLGALDSVTKRPGEKYMDFVARSKNNPVGRVVKLADIADNLEDQSALDPDEADFLKKRYEKARAFLESR